MSLWRRNGDKLYLKDKPDDFLAIVSSNEEYPETLALKDASGFQLIGHQVAPNLYTVEEAGC